MKEKKIKGWIARDGKKAASRNMIFFYFEKPVLIKDGWECDQWHSKGKHLAVNRDLFRTGIRIGECKKAELIIRIGE